MYDDIIQSAAQEFAIDPDLIRAFIQTESAWDTYAYRSEPTVKDASYGLMQILLGTAKSVSGNNSLTGNQLYDPATNIVIGAQYLRQLFNQYPVMDDTVAAYNAGSPRTILGRYINQGYVDKVKMWYGYYKAYYIVAVAAVIVGGFALWYWKKRR